MIKKVKLALIGGFFGAGKTTLMIELGKKLASLGKKIAFITNDQGEVLVDTKTIKDFGFPCVEVSKGCFCIKLQDFINSCHIILEKIKPDIILAEPVGFATEILTRVNIPLKQYFKDKISLSPFLVLVDASTILNFNQKFNLILPRAPLGYILSWQIKEADIIGINKLDLIKESQLIEIKNLLSNINQEAELIPLSVKTGYNVDELMKILIEREHGIRSPIFIDYDIKRTAGTELNWFNSSYKIISEETIRPEEFVRDLIIGAAKKIENRGGQVIHLKINFATADRSAKASLTNLEQGVDFTNTLPPPSKSIDIVINARAKLDSDGITECILETLKIIALKYKVKYSERFAKSSKPTLSLKNPTA
jgi:G3E family GTPase